jgi:hypothetical protein
MNKTKLAQLVEETINSMNGAQRAEPAPYLLTRINARMNSQPVTGWERMGLFLARPGIALATLAFTVILNIVIYNYSGTSKDSTITGAGISTEDYSMNNPSALFDLENIQP